MTREVAIRRIKARFDKWALDDEDMKAIQTLIPEIAMSEDERMINELQGFLLSFGSDYFGTGEWQKFDDWLEKQKEPLTAEEKMNHPLYLEGFDVGKKVGEVVSEQKPAEWSEEDELMRTVVIQTLERFGGRGTTEMQIDWLKSLKPQPHTVSIKDATKFGNLEYERGVKDGIQSEKSRQWKPSKEQITALELWLKDKQFDGTLRYVYPIFESLHNDLEKLIAKR